MPAEPILLWGTDLSNGHVPTSDQFPASAIETKINGKKYTFTTGHNKTLLRLLREEPDWITRLANDHPFIQAEVIYAARTEMAQTLPDVLMRRIRLGLIDWRATLEALPVTARLLAVERSWTPEQEEQAMATFRVHIEGLLEKATGTVGFRV